MLIISKYFNHNEPLLINIKYCEIKISIFYLILCLSKKYIDTKQSKRIYIHGYFSEQKPKRIILKRKAQNTPAYVK